MNLKRAVRSSSVRKDLEEIIQTCESIENRRFNPFLLDVAEALRVLRLHSEHLRSLGDHLLDMRTITSIARVVGLQSAHLRFQSSSLFVDPEMVKEKIHNLSRQQLAELFLLSWHPITELEQLTLSTVKGAAEYWDKMLSFYERRKRLQLEPMAFPGTLGFEDLSSAGLMEDKAFTKKIEEMWMELREKTGSAKKVEYWSFVIGENFAETVSRAQMVSFLISYGFAMLEKKGKDLFLVPREEPTKTPEGTPMSFPIPIPRQGSHLRQK